MMAFNHYGENMTRIKSGAQVHSNTIHNRMVLSSDEDTETLASTKMDLSFLETQPSLSTSSDSIEMAEDNDNFYFDSKPSKIRLPRKMLMKDPLGKLVPKRQSAKRKKSNRDDVSSSPCKKMPWDVSEVTLCCHFVRVGTMQLTIQKPVTFTTEKIRIDEQVCVQTSTVVRCEMCFSTKLPCLLLKATPAECLRLCYLLKMSRSHGASWFDSNSPNLGENYIILVFKDSLPKKEQVLLTDILTEIGRAKQVDDFICKITFEEANKILTHGQKDQNSSTQSLLPDCHVSLPKISTTTRLPTGFHPKQFQQMFLDTFSIQTQPDSVFQQEDSTGLSLSPKKKTPERCLRPRIQASSPTCLSDSDDENNDVAEVLPVFSDPVQRLILYPPPPARGGISVSNEDLHRLNQGEFLNDVIIDFYLKYLMLKEETGMRSHVFSSFFYRRLTQTEPQSQAQAPETLLEKTLRHSRVRTWTRNVDLFQKDFIFVPINESSHWFLAVICFPGLEGAQSEPGPPSPSPLSEASPPWPSPEPFSNIQEGDEGEPSCLEQGFPSGFSAPGPNPMSLFFRPMNSIATSYPDPGSCPDSFPDCDLTIGFSLRVCSDVQEKECRTGVRGQKADQTDQNHDFFGVTSKVAAYRHDNRAYVLFDFLYRPCILIMDSLSINGRSDVVKILQEYLEEEWKLRKGTERRFSRDTMRGFNPRVPQQDNYSDCGVYLLQYVESFFQNPPQSFEQPMDLSEWFPLKRVKRKRAAIKELIVKIHRQQEGEWSNS